MKFFFIAFFVFLSSLYANTLEEIREIGIIRIGILPSNFPLSYKMEEKITGFEIELAKEIASNIVSSKDKVELIPLQINQRIEALQNNEVDIVIADFTINKSRKEVIDFSTPYFTANTSVLTKKSSDIRLIKDLQNKKVAILDSYKGRQDLFRRDDYDVVGCKTVEECIEKLKNDEVVAFIADDILLYHHAISNQDLEIPIKRIGKTDFLAIATQQGNKELMEKINATLLKLHKSKKINKIYKETIGIHYDHSVNSDEFLLTDIYSNH